MIDAVQTKITSLLSLVKSLWNARIAPTRWYLFIGYRASEISALLLERRLWHWHLRKHGSVDIEETLGQEVLTDVLEHLWKEVPDVDPVGLEVYIGLAEPFVQVHPHTLPGYLTDEEIPEKIHQVAGRQQKGRGDFGEIHTTWTETERTEDQRTFRIASVTERAVQTLLRTLNDYADAVAGIGPVQGHGGVDNYPQSLSWEQVQSQEALTPNITSLLTLYRNPLLYTPEQQRIFQQQTRGGYQLRRALVGWGLVFLGFLGTWGVGNLAIMGYGAVSGTPEAEEARQFAQYQKLVRAADALQDTLHTLHRLYRYRSTHSWLFHQLEPLWPTSMQLEEISLESPHTDTLRLHIVGRVTQDEDLYTFLRDAGAQPFIAGVQLQQVRKNNPRFSRFTLEIACTL